MNKGQLQKLVGHVVRLQPVPKDTNGAPVDDDWAIVGVSEDAIDLRNQRCDAALVMGVDGVYSYFSDPARSKDGQKHGTLQLLMQVTLLKDGRAIAKPLPPPRTGHAAVEDEMRPALASLRRELAFNEDLAATISVARLGTPFSVDAIRHVLSAGLAPHFGQEMHDALLRARGAMENANKKIEASLQFHQGSNSWAMATRAAMDAIRDVAGPLVTLRHHLRREV